MAVQLIEVNQVHEKKPGIQLVERCQRLGHAVRVVLGLFVFADAASEEYVEDLADAENLHFAILELIEQHAARRRDRIVLAIRRARERAALPGEGPGDHASYFQRATEHLPRGFTDLVLLPERDHFFVRGYLKD